MHLPAELKVPYIYVLVCEDLVGAVSRPTKHLLNVDVICCRVSQLKPDARAVRGACDTIVCVRLVTVKQTTIKTKCDELVEHRWLPSSRSRSCGGLLWEFHIQSTISCAACLHKVSICCDISSEKKLSRFLLQLRDMDTHRPFERLAVEM